MTTEAQSYIVYMFMYMQDWTSPKDDFYRGSKL